MDEEMYALVKGRVQGVGFRATTYRYASQLGLVGTVRNLADGSVEIYAQGNRENLDKLMTFLQTEMFPRYIEKIELDYRAIKQVYSDFQIIH